MLGHRFARLLIRPEQEALTLGDFEFDVPVPDLLEAVSELERE